MDERNIVREMFNSLFNIVTGPGFYTVDGVKRKKLKPYKSEHELSPAKSTVDDDLTSDRENHDRIQQPRQRSSVSKYVKDCDNQQPKDGIGCWDQNGNDTISGQVGSKDNCNVFEFGQSERLKTRKVKQWQRNVTPECVTDKKDVSCPDKISVFKASGHDCDSKCSSSSTTFHHSNGEIGLSQIQSDSVNKVCDMPSCQDSDLVLSTWQGKRKHSTNKKTTCSKSTFNAKQIDEGLTPDEKKKFCDEAKTNPVNLDEVTTEGYLLVSGPSRKEADAQSDISTDSWASGYTRSRSAPLASPDPSALRKKSQRQHKHGKLPEKRCAASKIVQKETELSKSRRQYLKRKLDSEKVVPVSVKKLKVNQINHRRKTVPRKNTQNKTHRTKSSTQSTAISGKKNKPRKSKIENCYRGKKTVHSWKSPRSQQRLKQTKKTQTHAGRKPKQSPAHKLLKATDQKKKTVSKKKVDSENRKQKNISKQKNMSKQKSHHPQKTKPVTNKQQGKAKHKEAGGKKQLPMSPKHLLLDKQHKILVEHSKQAVKVEKRNILSALCQLEDKSQRFHSNDLDLFMPMQEFNTTSDNPGLTVRGQGRNDHPGGVWRKLIPEN